jgi:hypothetical protein
MTYKGIVRGSVIELEGDVELPEGTRVSIIPEALHTARVSPPAVTLHEWLSMARGLRAQLPLTSDSVDILRQLREGRASR